MKRYIAIIFALFGFLLAYYSGYSATISNMQYEQIQTAIKTQDYEYFLKFNSKYELTPEVDTDNLQINKMYLEEYDKVGYNIIIVGLNNDLFKQEDKVDNTKIILYGEEGKYEIPYLANMYISSGIINMQVEKEAVVKACGDTLTSLKLYNPNEEKILEVSINIDTSNLTKEYMKTQSNGYTDNDINELMKIKSYTLLLKQVGYYLIFVSVITVVVVIGNIIYKKVIFKP